MSIHITCLDGWVLESDFRKPAVDGEIAMPCPVCEFDPYDPEPLLAWDAVHEREHSVTEAWLQQERPELWRWMVTEAAV